MVNIILQSLFPRARPKPSAAADAPSERFDAQHEQGRLATDVLRRAAHLLAMATHDRGSADQQVQQFCDCLVQASPHLRLCWVWFGDADAPVIDPHIMAGPAAPWARDLHIPRNLLTRHGPAYKALAGCAPEPFNVHAWSLYPPWREAARRHDVRSVIALPLIPPMDPRRGLMVIYADTPDYFQAVGLPLFEALADLVGTVLSNSARNQQLALAARTDALTGLPNRAHAQGELLRLAESGHHHPVSVLLLDLDHFKQINDTQGHAVGDAVLVSCAQTLRQTLRRSDDLARWGGEEFVVWLPRTGLQDAQCVADKLRAAIAAQPHAGGHRVTASLGVAQWQAGELLSDVLLRADQAMYQAKHAGRNRVVAAGIQPMVTAETDRADAAVAVPTP